MKIHSPSLFIEINNSEYIFTAVDDNEDKSLKIIYKCNVPIQGIEKFRITDFDLILKTLKKNIYLVEEKLNFTFKETILILDNFNFSFINLSGFKKLNGSQILKENITFILNSLKSNINKIEHKKKILHIFNSKYTLDKKQIENLPIGLFGDFYSHELSFCLINGNDYNNLSNIFDKCNLKIKKILLKSFAEGSFLSNKNININTFYKIQINSNISKIFYFENDSLKFEQNFNFGSNIINKDISKITFLKEDTVKKIINNVSINEKNLKNELIEKELFENQEYVKIKKMLLLEIAQARIEEILNKILLNNINLININRNECIVFFEICDKAHFKFFKNTYSELFSKNNKFNLRFVENITIEELLSNVHNLVNFGWKKEAIPVTHKKKSLLARFFAGLFN
jgi:cell division protein FtsA